MITKKIKEGNAIFLFLFANTTFLLSTAVLWIISWLFVSLKTDNWGWFPRSGAVIVIIGAILSFRNVFRLAKDERIAIRNMNIVEHFTDTELADQERDSFATVIGSILMVFGTVVWAYGDLIDIHV